MIELNCAEYEARMFMTRFGTIGRLTGLVEPPSH